MPHQALENVYGNQNCNTGTIAQDPPSLPRPHCCRLVLAARLAGRARRAPVRKTTDTRLMTGPDLDPEQYPPIDPREPVPDDAGVLLPGAPDELPEAPAEPMPDDDGNAGGVREPA
ncbi:hypothetical protein [Micromonospora sp. NPDC005324]|uniref:hypothetical protein n=1 Tax=Micromonospora sp. NPDC005324 TaxID=3157033 RepID=UPI0033ABAF44